MVKFVGFDHPAAFINICWLLLCRFVGFYSCLVAANTVHCDTRVQCCDFIFTITAEIHARSLAKFYDRYADRHINLKFMRHVSKREREIRQSVIVKNKLMSVFNASVLLLTMNFVITLSK